MSPLIFFPKSAPDSGMACLGTVSMQHQLHKRPYQLHQVSSWYVCYCILPHLWCMLVRSFSCKWLTTWQLMGTGTKAMNMWTLMWVKQSDVHALNQVCYPGLLGRYTERLPREPSIWSWPFSTRNQIPRWLCECGVVLLPDAIIRGRAKRRNEGKVWRLWIGKRWLCRNFGRANQIAVVARLINFHVISIIMWTWIPSKVTI